ncbi:MAG: choice-of-anchor J domain-containing protein, partial [Prevotella sp.]|nr:choice-of-anchor J domain-containing protein [Prevotella sp.]
VSPATLSKDDAMSGDGATLHVHVAYTEGSQKATLTLKSDGAKDVVINVSWNGFKPADISSLKALYSENVDDYLTYRYSGEATVTYVDKGGSHPTYYLQDATGAITVVDEYGVLKTDAETGDRITGTIFCLQQGLGSLYAVPLNVNLGKVLSKGNTVEPVEATLADLKAAPADYVAKVVKVKGLKFKDVAENATFAEGMKQPVVTDGTNEANVRIFKGTTLIGKPIPADEVELTGILTFASATQLIIAPRGADDVATASQGVPSFEVTPATVDLVAGVVGKTTEAVKLHVSAKNMPAPIMLELTGAGANQFALSASSIDKGSSETDIVVSYAPTKVAKHKAVVSVDCPSLPELSKSIIINAYAIDEQNPPKATLNPAALAQFKAKAGETNEQTLEITTSGLPDFGKVAVKEPGIFRVNNTMLMKATKNTVKVTFAPTAAGTFTNALIISALGMDDIIVPLEGVATDGTQTEPTKEGDEFVLSTAAPVKLLNETFDGLERNKPLHLTAWTNSALQGTRAWWGYSFADDDSSAGEQVAKVTPYDSKVADGEETPLQTLLVTPALDFKNATSKMFTFRVRGDYLQDGQADKLELCYIDMLDGEPYVQPINLTMPCTKDQSGEWNEYHLDLAEYDLPDVMFMGFRFTGTRGRLNSATYYIDDVTYGRTDIPVIRPSVSQLAFVAEVGKDATSDEVTVATENLAEPVKLTLGGPNKSKFNLSTPGLGLNGGKFTVSFNSLDAGVHEAYVKLSSRGAADRYIALSVNNTTASGIASIPADAARIVVYDLAGHVVADKALATPAEAVSGLAKGVYVVKIIAANSISTYKVQL